MHIDVSLLLQLVRWT